MSTYLDLTNLLLRRLLDTELTETSFMTATSTQATAKDCVKAAVQEIYQEEPRWPFRYKVGSQDLEIGVEEYSLPFSVGNEASYVDWNSFRIQKDSALNINTTQLQYISHEEWMHYLRDSDEDSETSGLRAPQYVFLTQGPIDSNRVLSFGVTPSPDKEYSVLYDYNAQYPEFEAFDDETAIPTQFDYVIINTALKYFSVFKDNTEQAEYWASEAKRSLSTMRRNLIPRMDSMRSTVVNFGGYVRSSRFSDRI